MNEVELKKLWQTTNAKLEETLTANTINSAEISQLKVYHFILSMRPIKLFTLLAGLIWVGLGISILSHAFIYGFSQMNKFFLFSASVQVGLTAIALFIYLYQLIVIYQVDITNSIIETQKKIAHLKLSTLWVTRILFLQLPVWTTFWWNELMFQEWNLFQWSITGSVTFAFLFTAIWLFFNIKIENKDKKWFKILFTGKEWTLLMKSMDLLEQLSKYRADIKTETRPST